MSCREVATFASPMQHTSRRHFYCHLSTAFDPLGSSVTLSVVTSDVTFSCLTLLPSDRETCATPRHCQRNVATDIRIVLNIPWVCPSPVQQHYLRFGARSEPQQSSQYQRRPVERAAQGRKKLWKKLVSRLPAYYQRPGDLLPNAVANRKGKKE